MMVTGIMHPSVVHRSPATSPPKDNIPSQYLEKVEPSFLVAKDGTGIKLQEVQKPNKAPAVSLPVNGRGRSHRGLRRLGLCGKTPSGRRIGIDVSVNTQQDQQGTDQQQKVSTSDALCGKTLPSATSSYGVADRLSLSRASLEPTSSKTSLGNLLSFNTAANRRRSDQSFRPFMMVTALYRYSNSMREIVKREQATRIQAVFRGFLGRVKGKELRLCKRLAAIQKEKQDQLREIFDWKRKELARYHEELMVQPVRLLEAKWQKQSELVAQLISKVQSLRVKHANLEKQLDQLRQDNRRLVLANSTALRSAAQEELRINRIERCGLQLQSLANQYVEPLNEGKQRMRDFDVASGFNVEDISEEHSDRLGEIRLALAHAKAADDLLLKPST